jgi:hypothetical protein
VTNRDNSSRFERNEAGAPEAYIQFTPGLITDDGEVTDKTTEQFLRDFVEAFGVFITTTRGLICPRGTRHTSFWRCQDQLAESDPAKT